MDGQLAETVLRLRRFADSGPRLDTERVWRRVSGLMDGARPADDLDALEAHPFR